MTKFSVGDVVHGTESYNVYLVVKVGDVQRLDSVAIRISHGDGDKDVGEHCDIILHRCTKLTDHAAALAKLKYFAMTMEGAK